MTIFALDNHDPPVLGFVDVSHQVFDSIVGFLHINIRHTDLVEVLDLVICFVHGVKCIYNQCYDNSNMRQQSKSKTASSQLAKGGAVPTLTHQFNTTGGMK